MINFLKVLSIVLVLSPTAFAEHVRPTNPNAAGFEFFGRGMRYSVFFDHALNDDAVAGFSIGSTQTKTALGVTAADATLIPLYLNYYLMRNGSSPYVSGGVSWVVNSNEVKGNTSNVGAMIFPDNGIIPNVGFGFESRGDTGFLCRIAGYGMFATSFSTWFGFTFGYAF
jgi:hypothetical protein